MKRLVILAIAAAFVFGSVASAFATDLAVSGSWRICAEWQDNRDYTDADEEGNSEDDFFIDQRARTTLRFITSEDLYAVLQTEIGDLSWGQNSAATTGNDFQIGGDGVNIEVKHAYVDFAWPDTDIRIRAGLQGIILPGAFSNLVLDDDFTALNITIPFNEMFTMVVGYDRFDDSNTTGNGAEEGDNGEDEFDAIHLVGVISGDGWSVTPWGVYAWAGRDNNVAGGWTDEVVNPWWLGINFNVDYWDPIVFYGDLYYGDINDEDSVNDASGWFFNIGAEYRMDMLTPRLVFYWASGEDDDATDGSEQLPRFAGDYTLTTHFYDGTAIGAGYQGSAATGKWGLAFSLLDMSFMEGLDHDLTIHYARGTNDEEYAPGTYELTEDESMWEVTFDSTYWIYENLRLINEVGYINVNWDDDVRLTDDEEDSWKFAVGLRYDF